MSGWTAGGSDKSKLSGCNKKREDSDTKATFEGGWAVFLNYMNKFIVSISHFNLYIVISPLDNSFVFFNILILSFHCY